MRDIALVLVCASGCGFAPQATADATVRDGTDGASALDVAHVMAADEAAFTSTASWTVSVPTMLDTDTGVAVPALPPGLIAVSLQQDGGGPTLFVIQGARVEIAATLTVTGSRPLVLVSHDRIVVSSTIDAGAHHAVPGPGGARPAMGPGAGPGGLSADASHDAGAGGGSFGTAGAQGGQGGPGTGTIVTDPGPATPAYGDIALAILQGGSGGGDPSPMCATDPRHGGAGGGAVQLTAPLLVIDGTIHAGGGGAEATNACNANGLGGGGGGSGGAIYLQALALAGTGTLAANGGGGSGTASGDGTPGAQGDDAHPDATAAAGGAGVFGVGGAGAAGVVDAQPGTPGDNGGGGGGGAGRIFVDVPAAVTIALVTSPLAARR